MLGYVSLQGLQVVRNPPPMPVSNAPHKGTNDHPGEGQENETRVVV
jgi:hypothetical protein